WAATWARATTSPGPPTPTGSPSASWPPSAARRRSVCSAHPLHKRARAASTERSLGGRCRTRTCDPLLVREVLSPAELSARGAQARRFPEVDDPVEGDEGVVAVGEHPGLEAADEDELAVVDAGSVGEGQADPASLEVGHVGAA